MDNIVFTETGIIAIVTIFISLISTMLNIGLSVWSKKHDYHMQIGQKQFELHYAEKAKVFEEFATNASLLHTDIKSQDRYDLYYSSALKASLMCSIRTQQLIKELLSYTNTALLNGMNVDKAWEVNYLNKISIITFFLAEELKSTSDIFIPRRKRYTKLRKQRQ